MAPVGKHTLKRSKNRKKIEVIDITNVTDTEDVLLQLTLASRKLRTIMIAHRGDYIRAGPGYRRLDRRDCWTRR